MSDLDAGDLMMRQRALLAALQGRGVSVFHFDAEGLCDMAEGLPAGWMPAPLGKPLIEALPAPALAGLVDPSDQDQTTEFHLARTSGRHTYVIRFIPDGTGTIAVMNDVTEDRQRQAAFAALLREVSHRSKNLLAIVQSVAMQTANHADSISDFLDKFRGRLHALSSAQDLVTDSDWRGTPLQTLIAAQLRRVHPAAPQNVHVSGDNPVLTPNATLHVGLAIHELAANAAAYGALSLDLPGQIWFDAHVSDTASGPLVLEWRETFPPRTASPEPRFGALILERIVPLSVGGQAEFTLDSSYVTYRLEVPPGEFEP
jgi:two-component sensor histidine kinase